MITPSELREHEFKGAGRNAYKADDVDNFFGEVSVAYEKIFRENAELVKRVSLLADRLEHFKKDEEQIKQAVIGAQKAADIIVKEAENAVEDSKSEAEAILAAAKGEADIIKSDAEKQAIADSDLLISIARDKAEEIINKAKEEAHGILIEANDSAKDTVGAATRTITSESLHYEMLKKEVSEFRASILAQYKTHIELISKLPELAVEQAEKDAEPEETVEANDDVVEELTAVDPENDIVEFVEDAEELNEEIGFEEEPEETEEVIKTTLPYDFFEENSTLEFVNEEVEETEEIKDSVQSIEDDVELISDDSADSTEEAEADFATDNETLEEVSSEDVEEAAEESTEEPEDIPISKGFSINTSNVSDDLNSISGTENNQNLLFASFETIDEDEDDETVDVDEPKKKRGFFRRKK